MKQDKQVKHTKPKSEGRLASGLTRPGELYSNGDAMPLPEVVEKDSDSVWALWSNMVEGESEPESDKDFKETVPLDLDSMEPTQLMGLPDLPKDDDK